MFHFPAFPPHRLLHSPAGDYTSLQPGFPIRTPSDQRSIGNSPRPIAALHVLHRLIVPRHPPCALQQAHGFRYYFTPLPGYFSPFPHGTHPLSVTIKYSGLPGGPGRFTADSTSPLLLGDKRNQQTMAFTYRALTVYGRRFHALSANHNHIGAQLADRTHVNPTTPHTQPLPGITRMRFSLIRVRSADDGTRTRDPHLGKVMRYQLRYIRVLPTIDDCWLVRDTGIEPVTSSVSGKRSPAELNARV